MAFGQMAGMRTQILRSSKRSHSSGYVAVGSVRFGGPKPVAQEAEPQAVCNFHAQARCWYWDVQLFIAG